jgi:hypothetical protein
MVQPVHHLDHTIKPDEGKVITCFVYELCGECMGSTTHPSCHVVTQESRHASLPEEPLVEYWFQFHRRPSKSHRCIHGFKLWLKCIHTYLKFHDTFGATMALEV